MFGMFLFITDNFTVYSEQPHTLEKMFYIYVDNFTIIKNIANLIPQHLDYYRIVLDYAINFTLVRNKII